MIRPSLPLSALILAMVVGVGALVTKAVQVSTTVVTQQICARAIITGLPAGAKRFVRVYAYLTGTAAAAIKRSTAGGLIPVLTCTPLPT